MLEAHLPLFLAGLIAVGLGAGILGLSSVLGPKRPSRHKSEPFECGHSPSGTARQPFNVRFYLVAILFLVFDLEAVFIYPWAVTFNDSARGVNNGVDPTAAVLEMVVFAAVVVVGLIYAWRKGALDWAPRQVTVARRLQEAREVHGG